MTAITTAIFDLGNVFVRWDPRHLYRDHFADEAAMEEFLATVCTPAFNDELDRGRPFAEAIDDLCQRHPEHAELIRLYDTGWNRMFAGVIDDSVDVLAELRKRGVPLYAVTNWSAEKFVHARAEYDFLEWFDGIVVSGDVGAVKPSPEIFAVLCERHGVEPRESVFVDDIEANVAGARALGFDGIVFTDAAGLRREFVKRGLL